MLYVFLVYCDYLGFRTTRVFNMSIISEARLIASDKCTFKSKLKLLNRIDETRVDVFSVKSLKTVSLNHQNGLARMFDKIRTLDLQMTRMILFMTGCFTCFFLL